MAESEVARFTHTQDVQEQAAQHGMYGYAIVSRHAHITARLEQGAAYLFKLLEEGKHEEVARLMETPGWGLEEEADVSLRICLE